MPERDYLRKKEAAAVRDSLYTAENRGGDPFFGMAAQAGNQAMLSLFGGSNREVQSSERRVDLPAAMQAKMEAAFGADFSNVRLYENPAVADAGAKAVTSGSKISFAPGALDFSSFSGQSLLGHELSHVVSQSRGESRGSGFLNNRHLEAQADREGAMAASGATIYSTASPIVAPPVSGGGPVQAKLEEDLDDDEYKQLGTDIGNAGAVANPFRDKSSKPGFLSRIWGKMVASHREAVDNYNNYKTSYDKMSRWKRFKWAVSNPLAWLRGGHEGSIADTKARKAKKQRLIDLATALNPYYKARRGEDIEDAAPVPAPVPAPGGAPGGAPGAVPAAPGGAPGAVPAAPAESKAKAFFKGVGKVVAWPFKMLYKGAMKGRDFLAGHKAGLGTASRLVGAVDRLHNTAPAHGLANLMSNIPGETGKFLGNLPKELNEGTGEKTLTGVNGALGILGGIAALPGHRKGMVREFKAGDNYECVGNTLSYVGDYAKIAKSGLSLAKKFTNSEAIKKFATKGGDALGVASGAIKMASAGSKFIGAARTHSNLVDRIKKTEGNADYDAYRNIMTQGRRFSKTAMLDNGLDFVNGGISTASAIGKYTGFAAPVSLALYGAGNVLSDFGGLFSTYYKNSKKYSTVDESLGLPRKIKQLQKRLPGLSEEDAKFVVLRSMGVESGKRSDAFEMITKHRASKLKTDAEGGNEAAQNIAGDMNVKDTGSGYSLDKLITKLGGNAKWKKKKDNPFE